MKPLHEQLEETAFFAVKRGRWFAEVWEEARIVPEQPLRCQLPAILSSLKEGKVLEASDENVLRMMGEEIRMSLNELKPGYGDLAMQIDTSEHLIYDTDRENLRQLAEWWKELQATRQHLNDCRAAISQMVWHLECAE